MTETRNATASDIDPMIEFIFAHGKVFDLNVLPEPDTQNHIKDIATGKTKAVIAYDDTQMLGFATYHETRDFARYQLTGREDEPQGYINEVVVHQNHSGRGIATSLMKEATNRLFTEGYREIYVWRHADNQASAGMMLKSGFEIIDTFDDPKNRLVGSRKTTVSRKMMHPTLG